MPPIHCSCWRNGTIMTIWPILSTEKGKIRALINYSEWHQSSQAVTTNAFHFCPTHPAVTQGGTQIYMHMQTQIHITLISLLREGSICYSHMRKSIVKERILNLLQSNSRKNWSWSTCLLCQFFVEILSHIWSPHTCLNILQYSGSLPYWQGKADISLESHLQEFYSIL